ncbi:hypothetical protein P67b_00011 [Ruegeria phage Tedan]|nr:hypothetical protein P67b_00011 [Ruegeria phage Tedan]
MLGVKDYIIGTLVVAATATGVWGKVERERAAKALVQVTHLQVELNSCATQITDIREDLESDNEIDTLSDTSLVNVPDGWLVPTTDPSGN